MEMKLIGATWNTAGADPQLLLLVLTSCLLLRIKNMYGITSNGSRPPKRAGRERTRDVFRSAGSGPPAPKVRKHQSRTWSTERATSSVRGRGRRITPKTGEGGNEVNVD